jgi:hypothetical protein
MFRKYQPITGNENLQRVTNESFVRYFLAVIRNCGSADALRLPYPKFYALYVHTVVVESGNT